MVMEKKGRGGGDEKMREMIAWSECIKAFLRSCWSCKVAKHAVIFYIFFYLSNSLLCLLI